MMLPPFHGVPPSPPCLPQPPPPPPPPPPLYQHFAYSYQLLPTPPTPLFSFFHSSHSLVLCIPRFPFVSTYVAPYAVAPSPLPSPSLKDVGVNAELIDTAVVDQEKRTTAESSSCAPSVSPISNASNAATEGRPRPWLRRGRKHFAWVPRSSNNDSNHDDVNKTRRCGGRSNGNHASSSHSMEFEPSQPGADQRTSVMIKNIPNKFSREMLIALLDEHCAKENEKASSDGSPASAYDFVYLPIDFTSRCNLGYAFVNFTTAVAVKRLHASLHRRRWGILGSRKVSHVCYARFQGKKAFVSHFRQSCFRCDTDEFLPVIFDPPRNGSTSCPSPTAIGRRLDDHLNFR